MDFHGMKRKKLQTLCKKHGIPANLKNIEMASRLASLFQKETEKLSSSLGSGSSSTQVTEVIDLEDKEVEKRSSTRSKRLVEIYNKEDCSKAQNAARLGKKVNVPLVDERVKAPRKSRKLGKSVPELLFVDETFTRRKKRDRSAEETASTLGNIALRKLLVEHADQCDQEEAGGVVNVVEEARGFSNKSKTMDQEIDDSPLSSEIKAAESAMVIENVSVEKPVDISPKTEIFVETTPPPASVHLATVKDIGDEDIKAKEEILISIPGSDLKEHHLIAKLTEAEANKGENKVVELHDESNIAASPLRQPSIVGDFKGDGIERNEEIRTVKLHCESESGTCISPDRHALLGNSESDGAENSGANKAMEFNEESLVFTCMEERHEPFGYSGQDKASEGEVIKASQTYEEAALSTGMKKDLPLADPELGEAGWLGIGNADKSGLFTSLERQLLHGDSDQKKAEKAAAGESAIPEEDAKGEENKLQVDCDVFTGAEKHLVLETAEGYSIEASSSLPVFLIHEAEIVEETTPLPTSVHLAVSNPEAVSTGHILVKENNLVAKLAEAEASLENSAACCKEIHEPDESSSPETKAAESVLIIENVLERECEEKLELGIVLMAMIGEEKEQVSSLLIERLSPASVKLAVNSPAAELVVPTGHILASTMSVEEITKTLICTPKSDQKEDNPVAKLATVEATLEKSAASCNEIHSSKDDEKGSFEKEIQAENLHGNFSECSAEEQADTCKVGRISDLEQAETMDEVSPMEENVSECVKEDAMKSSSQPITINRAASSILDESTAFITPERRNLMLMEQENGKTSEAAAESVESHDIEGEVKKAALFYLEAGLSTGMHKDPELGEAGWLGISNADKSGLFTSLERQLLYGDSDQKKAEKAAAAFHDESAIPKGAAKSEENRAVELQAEKHLLFESAQVMEVESHEMSDVLTASGSHSLMRVFEPDEAENKYKEKKVVELLLSGDGTIMIKDNTAATCQESFGFTSPERNTEPHTVGKQEQKEVELNDESAFFTRLESLLLLGESGQDRLAHGKSGSSEYQSHHAALDFKETIIADSSGGSIASKSSYRREFNAGEETAGAEFTPKGSQAADVTGLDAIKGTSNSPLVDSVNLSAFEIEGAETIMDAVILALPAEGDSETIGEIGSHLEVAGTCSMVSGESSPSTNIQNQINDALVETAITDYKGNLMLDSSSGSSVSRKTCVLGGTEDKHQGANSEEDFRNTFVILQGEATGPITTTPPFDKAISLNPNEFTVKDNINEEDATKATENQSRGHSPHVSSVNLFDFDAEGTDTSTETERNVSLSSYGLTLPAEETICEISSHLKVAGTCSVVSEESAPFTDIQNQLNDALEERAITANNEANELIREKATKNLDSSGVSSVSEKTFVLGGTDDEHLGYDDEVHLKNTCEKSGHKFLKDEATGLIATSFAEDEEMIGREGTPSPSQEETLNESSENIDETEKQVRRDDPMFIYRTEVKPKWHDMKENAPSSKIVDHLNVTAPRTSKRQPLKDLRKS